MAGSQTVGTIAIIGTCDSKLDELLFLRDRILERKKSKTLLIDVGRNPCQHDAIDVKNTDLVNAATKSQPGGRGTDLLPLSRAEYINYMITCASSYMQDIYSRGAIHGAISIGGSCGTSLASGAMRNALPVGFPKLIVSTMASGDVKPFIEETDITMMYSVVDIAGTNSILNQILSNAAGAIDGMVTSHMAFKEKSTATERKRIGVTMFRVTTPCVDVIRLHLESKHNYEVYVFHATGAGGRAMERLIREGKIDAVIDVTTTEIADELIGGVLSAGPDRLSAAAEMGIPGIVSVGACDMVNFGPKNTVPEKFRDRKLHEHNPTVTIMRTSESECTEIGEFIAKQLRKNVVNPKLVEVILPTGGISMLSTPHGPFDVPGADKALFTALEKGLESSGIKVSRSERDINNPEFAVLLAESLVSLIQNQ
ncbi:hypothetical protein AJ79_02341 [Helicocarpus griseus UAMH5409]|uniref:Uncharacterized protein n=1 Tax=Helicocarpus griseus UAMH5409 TaxID=1447875 RepID=A0A2B7Y345_9EURO|nr:hypothetical protein AJ79_02341 [Helicocarpus griseus UAMH5409]